MKNVCRALGIISVLMLGLSNCKTTTDSVQELKSTDEAIAQGNFDKIPASEYPDIDKKLGEAYYGGFGDLLYKGTKEKEHKWAMTIADSINKRLKKATLTQGGPNNHVLPERDGTMKRDAHPKDHGCVQAEFKINPDLSPALAKGIFQPGASYQAWIRFSNGSGNFSTHDKKGDARGMAIKLMDIGQNRKTLLAMDKDAATQDFIMINHNAFFMDSPDSYNSLIKTLTRKEKLEAKRGLTFKQKIVNKAKIQKEALQSAAILTAEGGIVNATLIQRKKINNPLNPTYFSMTAYALGAGEDRKAIKFSAKPCAGQKFKRTTGNTGPDFLRAELTNALSAQPACFKFRIQKRPHIPFGGVLNKVWSVENSKLPWFEKFSKFKEVATITTMVV